MTVHSVGVFDGTLLQYTVDLQSRRFVIDQDANASDSHRPGEGKLVDAVVVELYPSALVKYFLLESLGGEVGADVPFFFRGGCAVGSGRGAIITPIKSKAGFWIVLLYPDIQVSTPEAYSLYDRLKNKRRNYNKDKALTLSKNIISK